jgi:FSR family fosmidomycin resistance protein-like MFS transporter
VYPDTLASLALAHALSDAAANFLPPLLPVFVDKFKLSLTMAGLLSMAFSLGCNFSQPVFGYLRDRYLVHWFAPAGLLLACGVTGLIGFAPSIEALAACLFIGGIGIALFHPAGQAATFHNSLGRRGLAMAIFASGGNLGFATGPLLAVLLYEWLGPVGLFTIFLPSAIVAFWLSRTIPKERGPIGVDRFRLMESLKPQLTAFLTLFLVVTLRAAALTGFSTFIPMILKERGESLLTGGLAVFLLIGGGALGGIVCGSIYDRFKQRTMTVLSLLISVPLMLLFLELETFSSLVVLFLAGFTLRAAEPANITKGQEYLTGGPGTAAAIMTGFAWGVASFTAPLVGTAADAVGPVVALRWTAMLPALAAVTASLLPPLTKESM